MALRSLLIVSAIFAACLVTTHAGVRLLRAVSVTDQLSGDDASLTLSPTLDISQCAFPFRWQTEERERLQRVLARVDTPPETTDELGLARYAEYALQPPVGADIEPLLREGMRRDPDNALYHYLLADHLLKTALKEEQEPPLRYDEKTRRVTHHYRLLDRARLDRAMREAAIGSTKRYRSRREVVLREQLAAMPAVKQSEDRMTQLAMLASVKFPEWAKLRRLARVNSFYLSLLLAEGKREEAHRFARLEERLAVQASHDNPSILIGPLVAIAISEIGRRNNAAVFRAHGLEREAAEVERRHQVLMGEAKGWRDRVKSRREEETVYYRKYAGIMAAIVLPVTGEQREWITPKLLQPSRLLDYLLVEEFLLIMLSPLFLALMCFAGLKILRWRLVLRGETETPAGLSIPAAAIGKALIYGALLPLALYIAFSAIPALSGRNYNIASSAIPFGLSVIVMLLWVFIVPAALLSRAVWRQGEAEGVFPEQTRRRTRGERVLAVLASMVWAPAAMYSVLMLPALLMLILLLPPALTEAIAVAGTWLRLLVTFAVALLLVGLALLPAAWERGRRRLAPLYLAHARAMVVLYAVLALGAALLYPALYAAERRCVRQDRVLSIMDEDGTIAFTRAEGILAVTLGKQIRRGAEQLGIPVPEATAE